MAAAKGRSLRRKQRRAPKPLKTRNSRVPPRRQPRGFPALAQRALEGGDPDAVADELLQEILAAAVKLYAAKVERRGAEVAPFATGAVTATETVVAACALIRAADLNLFDVAMWFHRPPPQP
jgi:hypothetical protein